MVMERTKAIAGRRSAEASPGCEGDCTILMLRATDPAYSAEYRLCLLGEIEKRIGELRAELIHEVMGALIGDGGERNDVV